MKNVVKMLALSLVVSAPAVVKADGDEVSFWSKAGATTDVRKAAADLAEATRQQAEKTIARATERSQNAMDAVRSQAVGRAGAAHLNGLSQAGSLKDRVLVNAQVAAANAKQYAQSVWAKVPSMEQVKSSASAAFAKVPSMAEVATKVNSLNPNQKIALGAVTTAGTLALFYGAYKWFTKPAASECDKNSNFTVIVL